MSENTFTKYTNYTIKELETYVADANACVQKIERTDYISVLPKHLGNIIEGVKACLSQKIGTYDRSVDGVILAFKNTKVLSPLAAIRPDSVRLHIKIRANYYVFRPTNGAIISGTVKYVSSNYLSAVIYRVFNVTIKLPSQKIQNIIRGNDIHFIIKSFDMKSDLPYIEGELKIKANEKLTNGYIKKEKMVNGEIPHVTQNIKTDISPSRTFNKPGKILKKELNGDSESGISQTNAVEKKQKPRKQKRRRTESNGLLSEDEIDNSISAILKNFEQEIASSNETVTSTDDHLPKKKKKKKEREMDQLEAEILQKLAAQLEESSTANTDTTSQSQTDKKNISTEGTKKRKKHSKPSLDLDEDDFEASIMSSILKCAAEAEVESDGPSSKKKVIKGKRKSVRFDDTIREASFNTFDSTDLLEISQLPAPTLSSTLNTSI